MTEQNPEIAETGTAHEITDDTSATSSTAASPIATPPAPGVAVESPHQAKRHSKRRFVLNALMMIILLIALICGSVFAAQRLTDNARIAPEVTLLTTIQNNQRVKGTTFAGSAAQVSCDCVSKHSAYAPPPFQPSGVGQVVIVSLSKQQLWAYQNGRFIMTSLVTTGMPQLPTPTGTFHIMMKESNIWFYSPWPYGSPYYYTPEHIDYAMLFRSGGFYLHNAPWRETFGPGTNVPHTEPDGQTATGSHGCVNMPTNAAAQLYSWIGVGATVIIQS